MTKATRTPGEWRALGSSVFAGSNCIGICDTDNASEDRYEANAWLMASAPDLLDALKSVVSILDAVRHTVGLRGNQLTRMEKARAAIAKVEAQS
jgi:hypothetical protein